MHQLVVAACELVGWLCAYEADGCAECGCYVSAEEVEVEQHLRVGCVVETFEKVRGERSLTDGVLASVYHRDVLKMCHALLHHCLALCVGEE